MYRRIPLSIEAKKVLKMLMFTLLLLLVSVSAYFFIKMSSTAEKGYAFRENQLRQKELESENRVLKQQLLEVQTLGELKNSDTIKKMAPPQSQIFVEPKGPLSQKKL